MSVPMTDIKYIFIVVLMLGNMRAVFRRFIVQSPPRPKISDDSLKSQGGFNFR